MLITLLVRKHIQIPNSRPTLNVNIKENIVQFENRLSGLLFISVHIHVSAATMKVQGEKSCKCCVTSEVE